MLVDNTERQQLPEDALAIARNHLGPQVMREKLQRAGDHRRARPTRCHLLQDKQLQWRGDGDRSTDLHASRSRNWTLFS